MIEARTFLEGAKPGEASDIWCLRCGAHVGVTRDRTQALILTLIHMETRHGETGSAVVLIEGEDFAIGPAPFRCDLCNTPAERPWWVYTTGAGLPAEDPEWIVCAACHRMVQDRNLTGLHMRSVREQSAAQQWPVDDHDKISVALRSRINDFLENLIGDPVEETP